MYIFVEPKLNSKKYFDLSIIESKKIELDSSKINMVFFQILIFMATGTYLTDALNIFIGQWFDGMTSLTYIGAMLVSDIIRNIPDNLT